MDEETTEAATDALSNIPGIGPARKAALYAAGITTREALAQASIEQIISLTGMPRTQAEKALETLTATEALSLSAPSPQADPPLLDEAMPDVPLPVTAGDEPTEVPVLPDDDQNPVMAVRGQLDNAAFRTKTALSDATRVWGMSKSAKSLTRLAMVLDTITEQAADLLRPKSAKRLAARLQKLSGWIEKSIVDEKPQSGKKQDKVRKRLKAERVKIEEVVDASLRRQSKKQTKSEKDASREPKRRQKRIKK